MAYTYHRHSNPNRTEVRDASGWLATFTDNCRTVALRGSERTFTEESGGIDRYLWVSKNILTVQQHSLVTRSIPTLTTRQIVTYGFALPSKAIHYV